MPELRTGTLGKKLREGQVTDNAGMSAKVALRLYFLRLYHEGDAKVFDACQGSGLVWKAVRKQFDVSTYWGVDLKAKSGRVSIDSLKILSQGVKDNVIDIDTYGEPWAHWLTLLPHIKEPTTVFLTLGSINPLLMSNVVKQFVFGKSLRMPPTLYGKLGVYANQVLLTAPTRHNLEIVECQEALSVNQTRYFGVHVQPNVV